ncbi:MAG: hypothetical protein WAL61_16125 [Acidimicrobiales bacterium]
MSTESEEGWFTDPFELHEARWMSNGIPTKLVRDGDQESYEDPPDEVWSCLPQPIKPAPPQEGSDEGDSLNMRMGQAAQFGSTWGSHVALPDPRER